jgi:lipoprotein NlpD
LGGAAALAALLSACSSISLNNAPIVDLSAPAGSADGKTPMLIPAPAPAPVPAPVPAPAAADPYYTVQKGDTLFHIATSFHCSVADLAHWNGIGDSSTILVGQRLRVRAPDATPAPAPLAAASDAPTSVVPIPSGDAVQVRPLDAVAPPVAGAVSTDTVPALPAPNAPASAAPGTAAGVSAGVSAGLSAGPAASSAAGPVGASAAVVATDAGSAGPANWTWPVAGAVRQGFDPLGNKGIDIAVAEDAPVVAAADGEVSYTGSPHEFGNLVILRHSGELLSAYAHLKTIAVKQGQAVTRGQTIATAGRSGDAEARLHFEIRHRGVPVDPNGYLPAR